MKLTDLIVAVMGRILKRIRGRKTEETKETQWEYFVSSLSFPHKVD